MFLYGNICQVYVHIVKLLDTCVVLDSTKSAEPQLEEIGLERTERSYQHVQSQVEFFTANQKGIVNVPKKIFFFIKFVE